MVLEEKDLDCPIFLGKSGEIGELMVFSLIVNIPNAHAHMILNLM